jgi:hypothetical protein
MAQGGSDRKAAKAGRFHQVHFGPKKKENIWGCEE